MSLGTFDMDRVASDGLKVLAKAIRYHADAQIVAAKIAANAQARSSGSSYLPYAEHDLELRER